MGRSRAFWICLGKNGESVYFGAPAGLKPGLKKNFS
jgi:hypothetical protein